MKVFAVLTMFSTLATACVTADETPELAPVAAEAVLVEGLAAEVGTEGAAALLAPITINGFCEELHALCTPECLELVGNAKGACLRRCQREYQECLAGE